MSMGRWAAGTKVDGMGCTAHEQHIGMTKAGIGISGQRRIQ